jgi:uncharacterized protein DUF6766
MRRAKYGFLWITLGCFLLSAGGHWVSGWFAFVNECRAHTQPVRPGEYTIEMVRDTLENWQSEFLQLIWQVAGLAYFLYVGSPQSKEGHERLEAKLDFLMSQYDGGQSLLHELNERYPRS